MRTIVPSLTIIVVVFLFGATAMIQAQDKTKVGAPKSSDIRVGESLGFIPCTLSSARIAAVATLKPPVTRNEHGKFVRDGQILSDEDVMICAVLGSYMI
jgi:hypothetical protein